jgi:SAM-dependent methyltransferase
MSTEKIVEKVRERYGSIAQGKVSGCGCECGTTDVATAIGYTPDQLAVLPEGANLGLGCGAPVAHMALAPGETVVDLGAGGGIDCFLAAREVGPNGRVIGVDMTPEMVEKARGNAARAGLANVEFRQGRLEKLPIESGTVDAITSNCVINLVPDKAAVFAEIARVLKPGGRLIVSDIVLDGALPAAITNDVLAYTGCVAGALPRAEYFGLLAAAGLGAPEIVKDVDYLASAGYSFPAELIATLEREGVRLADLAGKVRSVTYRAVRRR